MDQKVTYSKLVSKRVFWKVRKWSITWNKLTRTRHTYIHSRSHSCGPCGQRHGSKALVSNSARAIVSLFGSQFLRLLRKPEGIVLSVHFRLGPQAELTVALTKNDRSSGDKNGVKTVEAVRMSNVLSAVLLLFVSGLITVHVKFPIRLAGIPASNRCIDFCCVNKPKSRAFPVKRISPNC